MIKQTLYKIKRIFQFLSCEIPLKFIGKVEFPHLVGITISSKTSFGKNVIVFGNVTIGGKGYNTEKFPRIEDNVIIYSNSVIIGDITIGKNSIVGAGSVVIKDVPPNVIVAGNPAKIIKKIR